MYSSRPGICCLASKSAHELDPRFVQTCCMVSNLCSHFHISRSQFKTSIFFVFLVTRLMTFALSPSKITFVCPWLQQTIIAPSKACSSLSRALCGFLVLNCPAPLKRPMLSLTSHPACTGVFMLKNYPS